VYEGTHIPLATLPGMRDRTITISSGGKTFSFTGWKIGWVCATPGLVAAVRTVKQYLTFAGGGPFQHAIAAALTLDDEYYAAFTEHLRMKRDRLCLGLETAGFDVLRPAGTYFVTADIRPLGEVDGAEFCFALPERCGVVAVPNVVFYDNLDAGRHLVRFAFCKRLDVLDEAAQRLKSLAL
jgi:N-succinyldiaminopimelate aminotransferase